MKRIYIIFATLMISSSLNAMERESRVKLSENKLIKMSHWERSILLNRYIIGNRNYLACLACKKVCKGSNARMTFPFWVGIGYIYLLLSGPERPKTSGGRVTDLG